ncbi:uncharacterized protein LOC115970489 [Quercus lobata]|uniref:uncharacterized protein LOC115970489 n=1 Tax=Quercus lobata TaxID=97700 RepID=UPI001244E9DA|nr:uncharacterized protein LOC115970489 [Quercus lobata]
MDQEVVNSLGKLKLTKEEEEDIVLADSNGSEIFEECSLSLFGRLLSDRHQNLRALKNTLKAAWKMGSDLRIVEVGNNILQFKFGSRCQLEWVEKSGPWNFDNNLLLLCRWRKGLTSKNIRFSHSPFWVQIWGLPFENMTEAIGKDIGSKIGRVLEVDKRAMLADQAKFLRIRVEVQIDKPLRRGGGILRMMKVEDFGLILGRQYGEWLKVGGVLKVGGEEEKLKEQPVTEKGCSASMVVNGGTNEEGVAGSRRLPELVVGGRTEKEDGTVIMEEAAPLDMAKSPVTSNHGEQGEQVNWKKGVPEASDNELERAAHEGLNGIRTNLVKNERNGTESSRQGVSKVYGPVLSEVGKLSPLRIKETEGLSGEKRDGPVLKEIKGFKPKRLCKGEQEGGVILFAETAVTAEQHHLDK